MSGFFFVKRKPNRYQGGVSSLKIPDRPFEAFIFDCDGTLADTMGLHYEAWLNVLGPHGAELRKDLYYSWGGRPTREIVESLNAIHGLEMDPAALSSLKEEFYHRSLHRIRPIEPVVSLVRDLHGKKPLAVASGGGRRAVLSTLTELGLTGLFDAIVTHEDYVRGKPAPDPYLEAARRLGVTPSGCLVFEDTEIGRESAVAAGMECVLVPGPGFS